MSIVTWIIVGVIVVWIVVILYAVVLCSAMAYADGRRRRGGRWR